MNFLKNRTFIGIVCIVLSLIICFVVVPFFNMSAAEKTRIVRVTKDIKSGEMITNDVVQIVDVGAYNLPSNVVKFADDVVGKFAVCEFVAGDYIINTKLADSPLPENNYLYNLDGSKQAISVTVKSLATGLSGKLIPGDIVSIIAPDFRKMGVTVIPPELQFVEVVAVTASSGNDAEVAANDDENERELPSTVTLLVQPEQSKILAELEADGRLHLALVYRGIKENAELFIAAQDEIIGEIYMAEDEKLDNEIDSKLDIETDSEVEGEELSNA